MGQTLNSQNSSFPILQININHLFENIVVQQKQHTKIATSKSLISIKTLQQLQQICQYYTKRMKLLQTHLITPFSVNVQNQHGQNISLQTLAVKSKINVNALCHLSLVNQNCMHQFRSNNPQQSFRLQLTHEYFFSNLEQIINIRSIKQQHFQQKQIWHFLDKISSAASCLQKQGFKQPLLSPVSIKVDGKGDYFIGEWQFSHYFQRQLHDDNQHTNFFQQGQAYLSVSNTSRFVTKNENFDILTAYYWPPQGTISIQQTIGLGKNNMNSKKQKGQVFSLGMTLLHIILQRKLYQQETFSQKRIKEYIQQSKMYREQISMPLSEKFCQCLQNILKWEPSQRYTYDDILKCIHQKQGLGQQQIWICHTSKTQNQITKQFKVQKNNKIQQKVDKQMEYLIDYQKIDYTIRRQRRQWQLFQNRVQQSGYRINSKNTSKISKQMKLASSCNQLDHDEEDQQNFQIMLTYVLKQDSKEYPEEPQTRLQQLDSSYSKISQSIKLLDISNVKANTYKQTIKQPKKSFKFNNRNEVQKQKDNKYSRAIPSSISQSLLLKSSGSSLKQQLSRYGSKAQFHDRLSTHDGMRLSQDNIFTSPQLLALIRCPSKSDKIIKQQPVQSNLTSSIFIKEQFAKGWYEGTKTNGLRNGFGTFYYKQGGKYCGYWLDNKMHGSGTLYYSDQRIAYQGSWKQDMLSGQGILYSDKPKQSNDSFDYRDLDRCEEYWVYYKGQFEADNKCGKGVLAFTNGQKYSGCFQNDYAQGQGVFECLDGCRVTGIWKRNKLVNILKVEQF